MVVKAPGAVTVDGQETIEGEFDRVVVNGSETTVNLVQSDANVFYRLVREKLALARSFQGG